VIGLISTFAKWNCISDSFNIVFGPDYYTNFEISLTNEKTIMHLQGILGWGISGDVKSLPVENTQIAGIVLDSPGGRIYESRKQAELILENDLDTYSIEGCESACVAAYIAGKERYLAKDAKLGFHNYTTGSLQLDGKVNMQLEMERDFELFRKQGVDEIFLKTIIANASSNIWYPTFDTLINDGVVHGMRKPE
jgi:hypothetical protein